MNPCRKHPAARRFVQLFGHTWPDPPLAATVALIAAGDDTFGLVVQVTAWPLHGFHPQRLGPDPVEVWRGPLFSLAGKQMWDALHAMALRAAREVCGPEALAAVILMPAALDAVRAAQGLARAA